MSSTAERQWALILGGSSGLGLATAKKLSRHGFDIIIIHRDRKSNLKRIESHFQEISSNGAEFHNYNIDAANAERKDAVIAEIQKLLTSKKSRIRVLVHSIAKGNLKPMYVEGNLESLNPEIAKKSSSVEESLRAKKFPSDEKKSGQVMPKARQTLNNQDFQVTMNAMALSLYDWTKDLVDTRLFDDDARIISFTSEGSIKAWPGYAAVSAAKVTLEALTRNIALEFAPMGIKANCIQAGATDTRAFRMIPGHEKIKANALKRNPNKCLTTPEDVANVVYLLTTDEARWITGTVIKVDGGESLR